MGEDRGNSWLNNKSEIQYWQQTNRSSSLDVVSDPDFIIVDTAKQDRVIKQDLLFIHGIVFRRSGSRPHLQGLV